MSSDGEKMLSDKDNIDIINRFVSVRNELKHNDSGMNSLFESDFKISLYNLYVLK